MFGNLKLECLYRSARAVLVGSVLLLGVVHAQDETKVTFWTGHGGADLVAIEQIVTDFNEANPEIEVELVQVPPGATETDVTRLMTAVRGGTGPDVYLIGRFIVAQRAADGLLEDLTPFLGDDELLLQDYIGFARDEVMFGGRPYTLPFDTDARALYYNIDMLTEAGIDVSELDPANGPITLGRALEIGAMVDQKNAQGNYTRMGFIPWQEQGWHYTYGYSFGGDFYDEAACQVTPTDPNIVEAFQWVYDHAAEKGPEQIQAFRQLFSRPDLPPQQNPFISGQLAMALTGDWMIGNMASYAPDVNYGITYIPVPEEGRDSVTWAGGFGLAIPTGAKEPQAAFEFMKYMTGEEGQRIFVRETSHLPTLVSLLEEDDLYTERHAFFKTLLENAQSRPPLPVGSSYWDELTVAWEKVYLNQQEPQSALEAVAERVQLQLDRFCDQL